MADDIVQKIVIEGGDTAKDVFTEIAQGALQAFSQVEGAVGQATAAFVGLAAAGVAAAAALAGALLVLTEHAAEAAEKLERLSAVTGDSVEHLSALTTAAGAFGISTDSMTSALERFSQRIATDLPKAQKDLADSSDKLAQAQLNVTKAYAEGNPKAQQWLQGQQRQIDISKSLHALQLEQANDIGKLGQMFQDLSIGTVRSFDGMNISINKLREALVASLGAGATQLSDFKNRLSDLGSPQASAALLKLADIFNAMPDGVTKTALAVQLFGRTAGPDMIRFLNQGSAAIQAEEDRLRSLGIVLTDVESHALENFRRAQTQLGSELDVVKEKFAAVIAPAYTAFLQAATKFLENHIADIIHFGEVTVTVLGKVGSAWNQLLPALKAVASAFGAVTDAGAQVIDWGVKLVNLVTDPLAAGLKIAVDFVMRFADAAVTSFNQVSDAINTVIGWVNSLIDKISQALSGLKGLFSGSGGAAPDTGGLPMASGGLVRGRGGIDSNLAWLTQGEFVINASAVRAIGLNALNALNAGFAPRFASGGLNMGPRLAPVPSATLSGQRVLNLSIEGRSFSGLSIPEHTAQSLERFAVHSQIASTGRKQSWRR